MTEDLAADKGFAKDLAATAAAMKQETKVLVTSHVNPEGDALGSLIAVHRAFTQLGADSLMYMSSPEPTAPEYNFLPGLSEVHYGALPADYRERTVCTVDCGNAERVGNEDLFKSPAHVINIDHHSDNPRFGDVNLVAQASSTAEVIYFLLKELGAEITTEIAEALYTGILVDSGRFQYSSTTPSTFEVAAELIRRGIDHTEVFRHVFETVPLAKIKLTCRMFENLVTACDGRLAVGVLERNDFQRVGAGNGLTEGLVDKIRALEGVSVAALIYAHPAGLGSDQYRVSVRSSSREINVQSIAQLKGGGGHAQAAGFSVKGEGPGRIIEFLVEQVSECQQTKD